jgi:ABC-type taurine transport system ATPase subunit
MAMPILIDLKEKPDNLNETLKELGFEQTERRDEWQKTLEKVHFHDLSGRYIIRIDKIGDYAKKISGNNKR